jgi:hypothetical protein
MGQGGRHRGPRTEKITEGPAEMASRASEGMHGFFSAMVAGLRLRHTADMHWRLEWGGFPPGSSRLLRVSIG